MGLKLWTTKELLQVTSDYLKQKQIENPRLTAEVLLAHQLNIDRIGLYLNLDQPLKEAEISGYRQLIRRRIQREPLQYITQSQEFWSLNFTVDPRCLIPRPETELLVEQVLDRIRSAHPPYGHPMILDLGTGSGALATALAVEIECSRIIATDISSDAIDLARGNAEKHGVLDRIDFIEGNLFQPLAGQDIAFDFIVSNPPYVDIGEYNALPPEVRDFEPRVALDGGEGGMHYIIQIIEQSPEFLNPEGWLMLEMSPVQTDKALAILGHTEAFTETARIKDYSGHHRVVCARLKA